MKRQKTLNLIFGNSQDSQETQKQFIWAISEKGDDPSSEKKMGSLYVLEIYSDKLSTILWSFLKRSEVETVEYLILTFVQNEFQIIH